RNTALRPMASESHAQRNRPDPLAIEMIPTNSAALMALTWEISRAIGAACEIMAIPAVVFRKRVSHNPYHCRVSTACRSVKSCVAEPRTLEGWKPGGEYPSGGFFITVAASMIIAK